MQRVWEAKLEIDTNKVINNINTIKEYIGKNVDIMPVLKDNAYGTYIQEKLDILNKTNIKIVAVAIVDEGVKLRTSGYTGDIFVLNQPLQQELDSIANYNLIVGIGSIDFLKEIGKKNNTYKIHIEIGTGMGRTGIRPSRINEYLEEASKYPNIIIDGIYTHFSCSDCDANYTNAQIQSFETALTIVKEKVPTLRYIHCCNSAGIIDFPQAHYNLVRPGLILHGLYPTEELKSKIKLEPTTKLKTKISFIKEVDAGTSISYGRSYITTAKTKVATVPLGYADGLRRAMSNRGKVVVNGQIVPIIGKVCMDCFMIDVTTLPNVQVGDDVYIWDNENISIEDVAEIYDTINYEVLVSISPRVVREFK